MKKQISTALLGLVLTLAAAFAAGAQTARSVRVQIPFDFVAGDKQMPAGPYTVRRVRADAEGALLVISADGRSTAVVLTGTGKAAPAKAFLSFRQYGERYFLAEVSMPGAASVREVPKLGGERRIERESAAGGAKKATVVGSVQ